MEIVKEKLIENINEIYISLEQEIDDENWENVIELVEKLKHIALELEIDKQYKNTKNFLKN